MGGRDVALSSVSTSTITATCTGRTVSGVVAIRAYLGGEKPGGEGSRQVQRGFKDAASLEDGKIHTLRREVMHTIHNAQPKELPTN